MDIVIIDEYDSKWGKVYHTWHIVVVYGMVASEDPFLLKMHGLLDIVLGGHFN